MYKYCVFFHVPIDRCIFKCCMLLSVYNLDRQPGTVPLVTRPGTVPLVTMTICSTVLHGRFSSFAEWWPPFSRVYWQWSSSGVRERDEKVVIRVAAVSLIVVCKQKEYNIYTIDNKTACDIEHNFFLQKWHVESI